MKSFISQITAFLQSRTSQRNVRLLLSYVGIFFLLIVVYSIGFHLLMQREGQEFSWLTGFYWTLTVMSTLGFGDITFHTDLGRAFSMVVLLTGMISLLVVLPFTFIEFFYAPYMKAQSEARAPRHLKPETQGHVIVTELNPVTAALIEKLGRYKRSYVILTPDLSKALERHDLGFTVMVGEPDLPETFEKAQVRRAAMVVLTQSDVINTNITSTVREVSLDIPILATASSASAEEILKLAGATQVLRLDEMMGRSLARRTIAGDARSHVIGNFDRLLIAEATAAGTPLVGRRLFDSRLRETLGITVVGVWERGKLQTPTSETEITASSILVLAGSEEQLRRYDELFCIYNVSAAPLLIVGGGRVGQVTAAALRARNLDYRILERDAASVRGEKRALVGDAADIDNLNAAGIQEAPAAIITPHNDDTNIYLTILCRRLRPDMQILTRATHERNVSTLHRAGADFVLSYASMGANVIFNALRHADVLMLAEGLQVFRIPLPAALAGKSIIESEIRPKTGCSIVAVRQHDDLVINPDPGTTLVAGMELILIGTVEDENRFLTLHGKHPV